MLCEILVRWKSISIARCGNNSSKDKGKDETGVY